MSEELQRLRDEIFVLRYENALLKDANKSVQETAQRIAANIIHIYSQLEARSPMRAKAFRALMKWEQLANLTLTPELRRELETLRKMKKS